MTSPTIHVECTMVISASNCTGYILVLSNTLQYNSCDTFFIWTFNAHEKYYHDVKRYIVTNQQVIRVAPALQSTSRGGTCVTEYFSRWHLRYRVLLAVAPA